MCHVLGEMGDRAKATASVLDGWGTEAWVLGMLHDPDAPERFGNTPYKGDMPSFDVPPKEDAEAWKPMPKEDMQAAAAFLASQGDEPGEPIPKDALRRDAELVKRGERIVTKKCTSCHLWKGEGDDSGTDVAPEFSGWGGLAWTRAQVLNPGTKATYRPAAIDPDGTSPASPERGHQLTAKGHMPRFDDRLTPQDAELVARWTRTRARRVPFVATVK